DATNADGTDWWYQDGLYFVISKEAWHLRGGNSNFTNEGGTFRASRYGGAATEYYSSRYVAKP
ncbi:MAG: hypothetical protein RR047_02830, partial [Bacilli bacterium]